MSELRSFTSCSNELPSPDDNITNSSYPACTNVTQRHEQERLDISYVAIETFIAIVAVIGNGLVITVFLRERRLRKKTNYYIVSLAFADFLTGLFGIPFAVLFSVGMPRHPKLCLSMLSSLLSFCTISIFSLVLISVDRFMYFEIKSSMIIEITFCWIIGCLVGFLPFAWHQNMPITQCFYHNVVTEGYQMFRHIFVILLPACIIFTIYVMIYKVVLHQLSHETTLQKSICCYFDATESKACIHLAHRREIKITLNIFMIVIFFMLCWLPLNIMKSIKILCDTCNIPDNLITFGIILTHFNSAVNPLMYAYHLKDFRHAILTLIGCRRRAPSLRF